MSAEPDVINYESVEDAEDTIDQVYERVDRLEDELYTLLDQIGGFKNYQHSPEKLRESAEYVSKNMPHEALPDIVARHTERVLDNPEEIENWEKLEEAQEKAEFLHDQWKTAYTNLWNEFGFEGEELADEIEGIPPVKHFLNTWNEEPYRLFRKQETYSDSDEIWEDGPTEPTLARYFDIKNPTIKQNDDMIREIQLEHEKEREEKGRIFEDEEKHNDWRQYFLDQKIYGDKDDTARWIDKGALN